MAGSLAQVIDPADFAVEAQFISGWGVRLEHPWSEPIALYGPQWIKIPILPSSNHAGTGICCNDSQLPSYGAVSVSAASQTPNESSPHNDSEILAMCLFVNFIF